MVVALITPAEGVVPPTARLSHSSIRLAPASIAAGTPIEDNLEHLSRLIECAGDRLTILPGGGISTANRDTVAAALGVSELHGTKIVPLEV